MGITLNLCPFLRSCPFCGRKPYLLKRDGTYTVLCRNVGTDTYITRKEAIATWQNRYPAKTKYIKEMIKAIIRFMKRRKNK